MLSDEDFLRAIRANPGDDAPWLQYADWLLERGDPLAEVYRLPRFTNSVGMRFVLIPPGTFLMGSPEGEEGRERDEGPRHKVAITRPFHLGVVPVTQEQYRAVMGTNPSWFSGEGEGKEVVEGLETGDFPVEQVSWQDAVAFCRRLSRRAGERAAGRVYRLPTEAEWEYACRGGTSEYRVFHWGNALSSAQANFNGAYPYGGAEPGPYLGRPCAVGSYPPNGWGLCDLHGQVWEWCADRYGKDYYGISPREDPPGPSRGSHRVVRGGSWGDDGQDCRSAARGRREPAYRCGSLGFRVASVPSGR